MELNDQSRTHPGLPDPDYDAGLYKDVTTKRLIAWVIDILLISIIAGFLTLFSLFTALFILPIVYVMVSFLYRWITLAAGSATLGMKLAAVELRQRDGTPLDGSTAFLHTAGYTISVVTFPLQLISIAMMLITARGQGLSDTILGTVALNKAMR